MAWNGQSERVQGELVSGNYFDVLGVPAAIGPRVQRRGRPRPGRASGRGPQLRVLAAALRRRPAVLNQTITVNGHPMTIVGVSAAGFSGMQVGERAPTSWCR